MNRALTRHWNRDGIWCTLAGVSPRPSQDRFKAALMEEKGPIIEDFSAPGDALLVAFGGLIAKLGMPPFEFFGVASELPFNKMFIRDIRQLWYHGGLPGIADNVDGVARYLTRRIQNEHVSRLVFVGNSMGGYAAMMFGALMGADVVHSFSPQTFIGSIRCIARRDFRYRKQLRRVYKSGGWVNPYYDLKRLIRCSPHQPKMHVHFDPTHRLDNVHSVRLREVPSVELWPVPGAGHKVVTRLRDSNALRTLLHAELS